MLGLGTPIDRSSFVGAAGAAGPLFFSSVIPVDFFDTITVRNSASDLTITANQTVDSSSGWLKVVFDLEQTSAPTFAKSSIIDGIVVGQDYKISFNIFLSDATNGANKAHWPSGPTTTSVALGGVIPTQDITAGQTTLWEQTITASANASGNLDFYLFWNNPSGDRPNADAQFYIKDLKIENA
jgi:hypothetical protein